MGLQEELLHHQVLVEEGVPDQLHLVRLEAREEVQEELCLHHLVTGVKVEVTGAMEVRELMPSLSCHNLSSHHGEVIRRMEAVEVVMTGTIHHHHLATCHHGQEHLELSQDIHQVHHLHQHLRAPMAVGLAGECLHGQECLHHPQVREVPVDQVQCLHLL